MIKETIKKKRKKQLERRLSRFRCEMKKIEVDIQNLVEELEYHPLEINVNLPKARNTIRNKLRNRKITEITFTLITTLAGLYLLHSKVFFHGTSFEWLCVLYLIYVVLSIVTGMLFKHGLIQFWDVSPSNEAAKEKLKISFKILFPIFLIFLFLSSIFQVLGLTENAILFGLVLATLEFSGLLLAAISGARAFYWQDLISLVENISTKTSYLARLKTEAALGQKELASLEDCEPDIISFNLTNLTPPTSEHRSAVSGQTYKHSSAEGCQDEHMNSTVW